MSTGVRLDDLDGLGGGEAARLEPLSCGHLAPSLDAISARAASLGYTNVGSDRSDPHWQEAFLHPKQAQGIVVQPYRRAHASEHMGKAPTCLR